MKERKQIKLEIDKTYHNKLTINSSTLISEAQAEDIELISMLHCKKYEKTLMHKTIQLLKRLYKI